MQYVRSISGSVSKTWNSINPATLSGAIDVIVVEHEDGSLACSPFHVRFGKFMTLRPSEKKVEFRVNNVKQDYSMKLGEGGEAFFVFETSDSVPEALQTSPLVSPAASPQARPAETISATSLPEPEPLDLATDNQRNGGRRGRSPGASGIPSIGRATSDLGDTFGTSPLDIATQRPVAGDWSGAVANPPRFGRSTTDQLLPLKKATSQAFERHLRAQTEPPEDSQIATAGSQRSSSPPPLSTNEAVTRAINLSKKLWTSNIPSQVNESGDLMLDMTGYKSSEEEALRAEAVARKLLSEEIDGSYDIGALIGADEKGNVWIYSSEEAKEAAGRKAGLDALASTAMMSTDALSDPGYHSDDTRSDAGTDITATHHRRDSDSGVGLPTPPRSPDATAGDPNRNYAKTLRLTSEQLKAMNLKPGANSMSFSVNKATCQAYIYLWRYNVPVVISDIDGTITKSDALGHVLNMIGRDWTHLGVAKLYTDIVANGYHMLYLTSRSVGQADTTRNYLNSVVQEGYKLPKGPVIMSPDRTIAALRREIYLRKPEVFKMACLRDIMNLYHTKDTPFYAGFGNRLTDALSYRSVNIPSTRIFTINSNAEVSLDLLSLNKYKTGYTSMREIVDHYFPPVGLLIQHGGEEFTDFNYWREKPLELEEFSASESDEEKPKASLDRSSLRSEDAGEDLEASYFTNRESIDELGESMLEESILESVEGGDGGRGTFADEPDAMGEEDVIGDGVFDGVFDGDDADGLADDEVEIDQELDALDLASDRRPPAVPPDDLKADLKRLARVLDSPERAKTTSGASA